MVIDGSAVTSKTFVYTVSETVPDPVKVGIQYSTNVAKVYVTVTDDAKATWLLHPRPRTARS